MTCHKCAGRGTRAHHRLCDKRGLGHRGRGAQVSYLTLRGLEWALPVNVRRGRRGKGDSLPVARLKIEKHLRMPPTLTPRDIEAMTGGKVVVHRREGRVVVTMPPETPMAEVARVHEEVSSRLPAYVLCEVVR